MRTSADWIIEHLGLQPLDREGGYFRRTFTSADEVDNRRLNASSYPSGTRRLGTVIQYLLTAEGFSAMHRVRSPETWFFHMGDPLEMLLLHPDGSGELVMIGADLKAGQQVQLTVPAGVWQGCRLRSRGLHGYALCSAAVVPGFEWEDFELGEVNELVRRWPAHADAIRERVRASPATGAP